MIIDESREPDFWYVEGDKGCVLGYYKDYDTIPRPMSATQAYNIREGWFDDVTIKKLNDQKAEEANAQAV